MNVMRTYLIFFFSFLTVVLLAQDPSSIHLTEKDGLPDVEIYDIHEDNEGFIWLAADKGLFKYDGKNFTNYTHPEKRGLSVFSIIEDDKGRIWCKNITGQVFYVQDETMHLFYDLNLVRYGEKVQIFFREDKIILMSLYYHIVVFDNQKKVFEKGTGGENLTSLHFEYQGKFYNTMESCLVEVDPEEGSTVLFEHQDLNAAGNFNTFLPHNSQTLMYRTVHKNELFVIDIEQQQLTAIELPQELNQLIWANIISLEGFLWFGTNKGMLKYRLENNKLVPVNEFLEDYFVSDILIDKDNNYWVSTLNAGVFVIPNIHVKKYKLLKELTHLKAIKKYKNGRLLLGCFNGSLGSYDPIYQDYKLINKSNAKISNVLYLENKDYIFSSSDSRGFSSEQKYKQPFKGYGNLKDISKVSDTSFLLASYNRTEIVTLTNKAPFMEGRLLNSNRTYSCHYDATTKSYYAGNTDHLRRYDSIFEEHIITYKEKPLFVLDMDQTENNTLWVTTFKYGVLGIKNDSVVAVFDVQKGLPTNKTSFLYAENEHLWVATQEGVVRINTITEEVNVLTQQDGIPSYKIQEITSLGDEVYFASNEGLFSVDKKNVFLERKSPEVYFTSVTIADKDTLLLPSYKLSHDKNRIEIAFHSNGFQTDKNVVYEYKLNQLPDTWETLQGGVNAITFGNLEDGAYTFTVRARNIFNNQVSKPKTISFTVDLPYWERWWFALLLIVCLLLLLALFFRDFQKRKEKQRVREVAQLQLTNQLTSLKLENLRSQMNPHFIFNALNSIQEYIVLNQRDLASDYLGKFADLVRTYLKYSNTGEITLQEEIDCLEMYLDLEKMRFEEKLEYFISIDKNVSPESLLIPTMLIQPYVENAIKHGLLHKKTDRKLWIRFYFGNTKEVVICEVEDNGVGRERVKELQKKRKSNHTSFATKATDDRLALINKNTHYKIGVVTEDLCDENDAPVGTKVIITIPYKKD